MTDHKTGKARAEKDTVVGGGRYLQPLLYALASRNYSRCDRFGPALLLPADGGYEERIVQLDEENRNILGSVLSNIRQSLIDGFLPAAPKGFMQVV